MRNWGFECRSAYFRFPKLFLLSRCELCSLSGEELRKDEELRKELSQQEDMFFYYLGCGRAAHALELFAEEVLEVMEENRDKFSIQVCEASSGQQPVIKMSSF